MRIDGTSSSGVIKYETRLIYSDYRTTTAIVLKEQPTQCGGIDNFTNQRLSGYVSLLTGHYREDFVFVSRSFAQCRDEK
ncbi:hypothetical protein NDU88_002490 [Pleurodeles waltl]|uniref:Uncharacterized protein n=1 Tax=Pleurodeles waltl TaxID=8319 RepID=A0AAV7VCP3_PLEWA|nr:hypothetical protein NDU88_002490 [Pleurodeles waltl]